MKNAVIYARYSSQGQNEQSIDGQIRICTQYAESKGWQVVKVYRDKAKTGTNDHRPEFQQMISDASRGVFEQVIVYKFDRFARNRLDSIMYKAQLKKQHGVRVVSATEPVSDDEGGEIYEMFLEWNDEKYSERLAKRVKDGIDTSVKNGTFTGGYLIYGYSLSDTNQRGNKGIIHRVDINPEQAEVVRYIFKAYAGGIGKQEIADELNRRHLTYRGKRFTIRTFENWLTNAKYTGTYYCGGRLCDNTYPQIIDQATFDKVQQRLRQNKIMAGANSAIEPYILSGKLFCGKCGALMTAGGGTGRHGKKHYYYVCHNKCKNTCDKQREAKDKLERIVIQNIYEFLNEPRNVNCMADDLIKFHNQRTSTDELKSIEARIRHAQDAMEQLTNAFVLARNDTLRANIERKMDEQEILLQDLFASKAQLELERGKRMTKTNLIDFVKTLLKGDWDDKAYQKRLVDSLIYKVFAYDDCVITYFNFGIDKSIPKQREQETEKLLAYLRTEPRQMVQPSSSLVHQNSKQFLFQLIQWLFLLSSLQ